MVTAKKTTTAAKKTTAGRRIKNYSASASMGSIFESIQSALATHHAKRIQMDYDDTGRAIGIQFVLEIHGHLWTFRLPARIEHVARLVKEAVRSTGSGISEQRLADQAYRTAWANIRDWVEAQMALIDSGMVKTEEVFLPYLLLDQATNTTLFDSFEQQRLLPRPDAFTITEMGGTR